MPKKSNTKTIRVIDLFAGVGGFRIGLDNANKKSKVAKFHTIWSNQYEPSTNRQHASEVYKMRFTEGAHSNNDIALEVANNNVPEHDLLVGGFPCQDYSVARTLSHAAGLEGKKGVLWWQIYNILKDKSPKYLFLENVDRLLNSPSKQRGRDFAIMLSSLFERGYAVEWRIINAADYGMPQRRRRIFILGYKQGTKFYKDILEKTKKNPAEKIARWITRDGVIADAFPVEDSLKIQNFNITENPEDMTKKFQEIVGNKFEGFKKSGVMINGQIFTADVLPKPIKGTKFQTLGDIIEKDLKKIPNEFIVAPSDIPKWEKLKGAKHETRTTKDGFKYQYNEGAVAFPDFLDRPSRTIVTGEGGATPSRFKHVIRHGKVYRRLMPEELEKLCMFPAGHTMADGITNQKRAFFMGNALVVGVIEKIGISLLNKL